MTTPFRLRLHSVHTLDVLQKTMAQIRQLIIKRILDALEHSQFSRRDFEVAFEGGNFLAQINFLPNTESGYALVSGDH